MRTRRLFHAAAQHLVGRDEHDADDEGDGEGADEALPHARLADLLVGAGCGRRHRGAAERQKGLRGRLPFRTGHMQARRLGWTGRAPSVPTPSPGSSPAPPGDARESLTLYIHRALLRRAQVALLLRHDDVLDVLHGQVLTEGVVKQSLQLVHGQLLHVALGCGGDTVLWPQPPTPTVPTQPLRLHKPATSP